MPYTTTTELRTRLSQEVGDTSPSSDLNTRYVNLLDEAHKKILAGGGELNLNSDGTVRSRPYLFSWALELNPIVFNSEEPITTGTVTVTKNSTAATLSSAPAASVAGWYLKVDGTQKLYRVTAHTAATTALTLDGAYTDTSVVGASYRLVKLDYTIGDGSTNKILAPADYIRTYYPPYRISVVDHPELLSRFPRSLVYQGQPYLMSLKKVSSGQMLVSFSTYPENIERFELQYVKVPTTLDTSGNNPVIPEEDRDILVYFAAFYHMRKTDDARAAEYLAMAQARFEAMKTKDMQFVNANDERFGVVSPLGSEKHVDMESITYLSEDQLRFLGDS